jgi:ankyrin repeat protein
MLASRSESVDIFIAVGIGDEKTITKLLKSTNGSAANARDPDQFTPLHWAVRNQQAEAVKLLVNSKADPNAESFGGVRPLHLAIRTKNAELIKYLRSVGAELCQ